MNETTTVRCHAVHAHAALGCRLNCALRSRWRNINLAEVVLRHGGEAQAARETFAAHSPPSRRG